jgi:hypothetical protein
MSDAARLVLYHKQATSARLRFLRYREGRICTLSGFPEDAKVRTGHCPEVGGASKVGKVHTHPGMLLRAAERELNLPLGCIEADGGFRCHVIAGSACMEAHLAHFTSVDPPFEAAEAAGATFIDLTEARGLPAAELGLLRLAYEHVLG